MKGKFDMKKTMKALALSLLLLTPMTLASCSQIQSTASKADLDKVQSQAGEALGNAKAESEKALNTAKEEANKAISNAQDSGKLPTNETIQKTWDGIKTQFDTLISKASSPENKQKITDVKNQLEQKFNQLNKDISSNKDVQNTSKAVKDFFTEVTQKLGEITKNIGN